MSDAKKHDKAEDQEMQDANAYYDDSYMNSLVADAEELMPSEEFEEIDEPVRQMQESVQKFQEAEKLEGPQPETWQAFQPQHQQIVENMDKIIAELIQAYGKRNPSKPYKIRASRDFCVVEQRLIGQDGLMYARI